MAELPEIKKICRQMNELLLNKTIQSLQIKQQKCTNTSGEDFNTRAVGKQVLQILNIGKWFRISLSGNENLLISLGMGADMFYFPAGCPNQDKYQIKVVFTDNTGFTIRYWWFGSFFLLNNSELKTNKLIKDIAIDAYDPHFTYEYLEQKLRHKNCRIKSFLLDQKNVSGIGNMYMHDILFLSRLHPNKKTTQLNSSQLQNLYSSIQKVFAVSEAQNTSSFDYDFLAQKGNFNLSDFLIGYQEGKPCPVCGTPIQIIKTGSTASYICPECQKLD